MQKVDDSMEYEPDFPGERWSEEDKILLEPFVTNPEGLISVLSGNLPAEIVGALCSRASRASGSLVHVLLKEYLRPIIDGEDIALGKELKETVEFLRTRGFKNILNNQRAQAFYAKWLSQYGDDSIAQMTGSHILFWGISQVAMKFIEDQRIGLEPIEKSTRYVNFGNKINGRYLYYIPKPDLEKYSLLQEYKDTLDHLFDTYINLLPRLIDWLKKNYNDKDSVLEKKAFDTLRGLLPMATLSQVAFRGNAQAFEYMINRTAHHSLGELRWISKNTKVELDKEIPSLLLRLDDEKSTEYQDYLSGRKERVRSILENTEVEFESKPSVKLMEYDTDAEEKILTAILFEQDHGSWQEIRKSVDQLSNKQKDELMQAYIGKRSARWQKIGRAFENSYVRFEIVMDIGAYRDVHRHRMMTQGRQLFSTHHGYDIPKEIQDSGLEKEFVEALERAAKLYEKLEAHDRELAQYAVPLAYRVRFYQWKNFRQLFWEMELRTISQGHPSYRTIEQEKYQLIKEKFPRLAAYMLVDLNDYPIARRGTEEKIAQKEQDVVKKLATKRQKS